jgi:acetyl-CoA carboxylase biotin carboxylase subunit
MTELKKILIANRGEIAIRLTQTMQEMGVRVVAIYSDSDARSPHVAAADEAYPLHGTAAAETYLDAGKIVDIARAHGVDAIHPGYGFLSENADFAQRCEDAGLTFIGPPPDVIRAMGDKIVAKKMMAEADVPVVPGATLDAEATPAEWRRAAEAAGFPVLVKAAAGGGGKGMRVVETAAALEAAVEAAAREAKHAFGDSRVFLERYLRRPRHVEFQVFGDAHGGALHMFERECSIQRRHQKVVEETPSPALTPALRARMGEAAVRAVRKVGYRNAGTVEFILDESGAFYFLEMNTRLQVEHPVTELTIHRDLVRLQLQVAQGEPLGIEQGDLRQDGHAIECRIYAEDAEHGFLPSTGRIERLALPNGPGIRVDCGIAEGYEVSVHHDPMLAKLCVWAQTRSHAIDKMRWALRHFVVLGVRTNIDFLQWVIEHPEFRAGHTHTGFIEENRSAKSSNGAALSPAVAAVAGLALDGALGGGATRLAGTPEAGPASLWETAGAWRMLS